MNGMMGTPTPLGAGLMVYLTREQRRQLREVLKGEGIYSVSGWLRQVIVRKLREAAPQDDHDEVA